MPTPQNLPALIKEMQERARKSLTEHYNEPFYIVFPSTLDTLIADTTNATLEYVINAIVDIEIPKDGGDYEMAQLRYREKVVARLTSNPDALKAIE
jgi:hypothetical protein